MAENFIDRRKGLLQKAVDQPALGVRRPDPLQPRVAPPVVSVGVRGYSLSIGAHQDVYVDGNDTDGEKPVPTGLLRTDNYLYTYDEGTNTFNRLRGNYNEVILPPTARTATNQSANLDNFNARGGHFLISVTALGAGVTLVPSVFAFDPQTGLYYPLLNDPTAGVPYTIAATGTYIQKIYPGISPIPNLSTSDILPRIFMFRMTHTGAAGSATYSVSFNQVI